MSMTFTGGRPLLPEPIIKVEKTPAVPLLFSVGVDLENINDSTAICVCEVWQAWEVTYETKCYYETPQIKSRKQELSYLVRLLHRPRIGTGYPAVITQVRDIIADLPEMPKKPMLLVDATGLGTPVVQRMREIGMQQTIGLTITGGESAKLSGRDWTCPKGILVGTLRLVMHRGLLKVAKGFAARETLQAELAAFTAKLSASGRATFGADGAEHDDTVLALALSVLAAPNRNEVAHQRLWF